MRRIFRFALCVICLAFLAGCATSTKSKKPLPIRLQNEQQAVRVVDPEAQLKEADTEAEAEPLENIKEDVVEQYLVPKGIILAKTDFQGVLEKHYVKLDVEALEQGQEQEKDQEQEPAEAQPKKKKFQIYVGDKTKDNPFPWEVKNVKPGHFFIELPAGEYHITSISIPVGSTMAKEPIDIRFSVTPGEVTYIGTLKAVGTKERIRLGGVPVIKPGFEYNAEILDEHDETIAVFRTEFPQYDKKIFTKLMQLHLPETKNNAP